MPNWLIPTGEILFSGNEARLRTVVGSLNGKLHEGGRFSCTMGSGPASFRFKMPTVFRCAFEPADGGLRITWQALPGLSTLLLFAALVLMVLGSLLSGGWELAGWMLCLLGLLVFLYLIQRGTAVEQFTGKFGK